MRRVAQWMGELRLQLALAKTEIVILSGRRIKTIVPIRIGDQFFETKLSAVYLGVTIDTKLKFAKHIQKATKKASIRVGQLSLLMANTRGSRQQSRRILMSTIHSTLLLRNHLGACGPGHRERSANRPPCVRAKAHVNRTREIGKQRAIVEACAGILATWQQRWAETKSLWTHRLIPSISEWANREHGEVNFFTSPSF